ncbi:MAG: ribosome maturation factor RimM [Acidimicrobiia bacterium]|nr:ribosome maturation factor RimM [Acidimicrobiia bacterium]
MRSNSSTDQVPVGRIGPPHGLDGTVYVWPDTDDPTRFLPGARLQVEGREIRVERIRRNPERLFVKFHGISDRTSAERLRGRRLFIEERQRRPLGDGEYWPDQLEGLQVRTPRGESVGLVKQVVWAEVQNRLVIETKAGLREVPFVDELVPQVNPDEGYLTVVDVPGLL